MLAKRFFGQRCPHVAVDSWAKMVLSRNGNGRFRLFGVGFRNPLPFSSKKSVLLAHTLGGSCTEAQTFCCIHFVEFFFPFLWICFPFFRTTLCRLRIKRVVDSILSIAANGPVKNTLHSTGHKATLRQREKGEVAQKGQRRDWCVEGGFTVSTSSHTLRRRCSVLRHGPLGLQHCLEPARHAPDHLRDRLGVVLVHPIDGVPHPGPEGL